MLAARDGGGRPIEVFSSLYALYKGIFEFFELNKKQIRLMRIDPKRPNTIFVKWVEGDEQVITALWILPKEVIGDERYERKTD